MTKTEQEKKPWTPFFFFMMQMRDKIKDMPMSTNKDDNNSGRIGRIASELWSNLSTEEKEKYRVDAYNRAVEHGQNVDVGYLRSSDGANMKANSRTQKKKGALKKENPEEPPGYTSSLSDN